MTDYYKVCRADGFDYWKREIDYRGNIGGTVFPANPQTEEPYRICKDGVIHAFDDLDYGIAYMVKLIGLYDLGDHGFSYYRVQGTPVAQLGTASPMKYGFLSLIVAEEL
jgi:hypothetical protein